MQLSPTAAVLKPDIGTQPSRCWKRWKGEWKLSPADCSSKQLPCLFQSSWKCWGGKSVAEKNKLCTKQQFGEIKTRSQNSTTVSNAICSGSGVLQQTLHTELSVSRTCFVFRDFMRSFCPSARPLTEVGFPFVSVNAHSTDRHSALFHSCAFTSTQPLVLFL